MSIVGQSFLTCATPHRYLVIEELENPSDTLNLTLAGQEESVVVEVQVIHRMVLSRSGLKVSVNLQQNNTAC